jgi:HEAT repeat protein
MRRAGIVFALGLCVLPAAHGELILPLTPEIEHALTPIDSIPTKQELEGDGVFGSSTEALENLVGYSQNKTLDFGVRLRAIRALPHYCPVGACAGTVAHVALVARITDETPVDGDGIASNDAGKRILELRAAIEALGAANSGDPDDVLLLLPFLSNPSRDLRAAAAHALGDICDPVALVPLRARRQVEEGPSGVPHVLEAIADALRDLDQCSP